MTRVRPKNRCKDPMKMIVLVPLQKHSIDCLIESQTQGFCTLFAKQASISVTPKWKTGGWFWYIPNRAMFFMLSASAYTRKHLYSAKFNCVHYFDRARTAMMRTAFACDIFCSLYDDMLCAKWKWLRFPMCVRICWKTETAEPTHNHHTISKYNIHIHPLCACFHWECKVVMRKKTEIFLHQCVEQFLFSRISSVLQFWRFSGIWFFTYIESERFECYPKHLRTEYVRVWQWKRWTAAAVGAATASASASTASHTQHWNFSHFDVQIFRLSRRQQYDSVLPFSLNIAFSANTRTIYFIVRFENIFPKNHVYESTLKFVEWPCTELWHSQNQIWSK